MSTDLMENIDKRLVQLEAIVTGLSKDAEIRELKKRLADQALTIQTMHQERALFGSDQAQVESYINFQQWTTIERCAQAAEKYAEYASSTSFLAKAAREIAYEIRKLKNA